MAGSPHGAVSPHQACLLQGRNPTNDFDGPLIYVAVGWLIYQRYWRHFPYAGQASHATGPALLDRINPLRRLPRQIWFQKFGRYLYRRHFAHVCRSYQNLAIHHHPYHRQRRRLPSFRRLQIPRHHLHHPSLGCHRHRFGLRQRLTVRHPVHFDCHRHHLDRRHYQNCHPDQTLSRQGRFQVRQSDAVIIRQIAPGHQASSVIAVTDRRPGSGSRGAINPSPLRDFWGVGRRSAVRVIITVPLQICRLRQHYLARQSGGFHTVGLKPLQDSY